jgi:hypothetical protein
MKKVIALTAALTLSASAVIAGEVNNGNVTTFQSGQPAVAADVNSTFAALITAINDNATRIATLEEATPDNSVAGKTYAIRSINSQVAAGGENYTPSGPNGFVNVSNGTLSATLTFDSAGLSGTFVNDDGSDQEFEVNVPTNKIENFTDDLGDSGPITFEQVGSNLAVTFDEGGGEFFTINFLVSGDGSLLVATTSEFDSNEFNDGSTGESAFVELLIGVQASSAQ